MLITVNRSIFLALTEQLQNKYVYSCVNSEWDEYNEEHRDINVEEVSKNIASVIRANEKTIKKVGLESYYLNDMKAEDYVSGYYYASGKIVICPFDWSMSDEHDEEFEYTFTLARMI